MSNMDLMYEFSMLKTKTTKETSSVRGMTKKTMKEYEIVVGEIEKKDGYSRRQSIK